MTVQQPGLGLVSKAWLAVVAVVPLVTLQYVWGNQQGSLAALSKSS